MIKIVGLLSRPDETDIENCKTIILNCSNSVPINVNELCTPPLCDNIIYKKVQRQMQ